MILNPAIIALLVSGLLVSLLVAAGAFFGIRVLHSWKLTSGSELQLSLEKTTYLVSTFLNTAFVFQMASFFLFIATAEDLHSLFSGAMCAAGALNVNSCGYPALVMKTAVFLLAGLWLVLNHADNLSPFYPLIKIKYALLLCIVPFSVAETILLWKYLLALEADIITSCCGTLFSAGGRNIFSGQNISLAWLPAGETFWAAMSFTLTAGVVYLVRGKGGVVYAASSLAMFVVAYYALVVYISPFIYELPHHNCPFCMLQGEYNGIGYALFVFLMTGTICGTGGGVLRLFSRRRGLEEIVPVLCGRLVFVSLAGFLLFLATVAIEILTSHLRPS